MKARLNIDVTVKSNDPDVSYVFFRDFPVDVLGETGSGYFVIRGTAQRYRKGYYPMAYDGVTTFAAPHQIRFDIVPRLPAPATSPAPEYFEPREGVKVRV